MHSPSGGSLGKSFKPDLVYELPLDTTQQHHQISLGQVKLANLVRPSPPDFEAGRNWGSGAVRHVWISDIILD